MRRRPSRASGSRHGSSGLVRAPCRWCRPRLGAVRASATSSPPSRTRSRAGMVPAGSRRVRADWVRLDRCSNRWRGRRRCSATGRSRATRRSRRCGARSSTTTHGLTTPRAGSPVRTSCSRCCSRQGDWRQRERWMYEKTVAEPRLTAGFSAAQPPGIGARRVSDLRAVPGERVDDLVPGGDAGTGRDDAGTPPDAGHGVRPAERAVRRRLRQHLGQPLPRRRRQRRLARRPQRPDAAQPVRRHDLAGRAAAVPAAPEGHDVAHVPPSAPATATCW